MGARKADWPPAAARTRPQAARIAHAGWRAELKSRAKVLAATLTARAQNFAATCGFLACEETVATGAYQIAGLKCPLHNVLEKSKLFWCQRPGAKLPEHPKNSPLIKAIHMQAAQLGKAPH